MASPGHRSEGTNQHTIYQLGSYQPYASDVLIRMWQAEADCRSQKRRLSSLLCPLTRKGPLTGDSSGTHGMDVRLVYTRPIYLHTAALGVRGQISQPELSALIFLLTRIIRSCPQTLKVPVTAPRPQHCPAPNQGHPGHAFLSQLRLVSPGISPGSTPSPLSPTPAVLTSPWPHPQVTPSLLTRRQCSPVHRGTRQCVGRSWHRGGTDKAAGSPCRGYQARRVLHSASLGSQERTRRRR